MFLLHSTNPSLSLFTCSIIWKEISTIKFACILYLWLIWTPTFGKRLNKHFFWPENLIFVSSVWFGQFKDNPDSNGTTGPWKSKGEMEYNSSSVSFSFSLVLFSLVSTFGLFLLFLGIGNCHVCCWFGLYGSRYISSASNLKR